MKQLERIWKTNFTTKYIWYLLQLLGSLAIFQNNSIKIAVSLSNLLSLLLKTSYFNFQLIFCMLFRISWAEVFSFSYCLAFYAAQVIFHCSHRWALAFIHMYHIHIIIWKVSFSSPRNPTEKKINKTVAYLKNKVSSSKFSSGIYF